MALVAWEVAATLVTPGQPLARQTLTRHEHCALALDVLGRHGLAARLASHDPARSEKPSVSKTAGTLIALLRDAPVESRQMISLEDYRRGAGQHGPCRC
jgi:hypothetical protein